MDNSAQLAQLLQNLQNDNSKAIEELYQSAYPYVANFILNNEGTMHDARRCFRRALAVFFKQLLENQCPTDCKIETYLFALTRTIWMLELAHRGKSATSPDTGSPEAQLPIIHQSVLRSGSAPQAPSANLMRAMDALPPDHKKFLLSYYFYKVPLHKIAEELDYSDSFARTKKRRCLDELRRLMNEEQG